MRTACGKKDEVVRITNIMPFFEPVLYELVELVHIDVYEQLGRKVTERQTDGGFPWRIETPDYVPQKPQSIRVGDMTAENFHKRGVVDIREELPYVALQNPARAGIVFAYGTDERAEAAKGLVRPLARTARVRIRDELPVEERIKNAVYGVMHEPVTHACLMDIAPLRVGYREMAVAAVLVRPCAKLGMQDHQIIHKA